MRAYFSVQKTWPPVLMGTLTTGVFALSSWLLIQAGHGFQSLPIAASLAAVFLAAMMLWTVNRGFCKIDFAGFGATSLKSLAAGGAASAFAWGALKLATPVEGGLANFGLLAIVCFVLVCSAWVYYFVARLMKMPETDTVSRAMRRGRD